MASPPFAVDKEMVGNDSEGAVGDGLLRRYCCWATAAERRAAWAVWPSFVFGVLEKNFVNRVALEKDALLVVGFSGCWTATEPVGDVANGLPSPRRGIVSMIDGTRFCELRRRPF